MSDSTKNNPSKLTIPYAIWLEVQSRIQQEWNTTGNIPEELSDEEANALQSYLNTPSERIDDLLTKMEHYRRLYERELEDMDRNFITSVIDDLKQLSQTHVHKRVMKSRIEDEVKLAKDAEQFDAERLGLGLLVTAKRSS